MSSSDIQKRTIRETFDILGYAASVGAPEGEARTAVRAVLEGFDTVHSASGGDVDLLPRFDLVTVTEGEWQVQVNSEVLDTVDALPIALGILEWRLVSAALEQRTDLFHLHGSALCLPAHRAGLVLVGGIAGWLAGQIVKGMGFGLIGNIVVGIVGAFIGTWLLGFLGISIGGGIIASVIRFSTSSSPGAFPIRLLRNEWASRTARSLATCPAQGSRRSRHLLGIVISRFRERIARTDLA